jgi:hypothetical protein
VSKQWDGADAGVYRIPADVVAAPTAPAAPVPMARVGTAAGTAHDLVTGGDVTPDGTVIALRTYRDLRLWDRDPGESVADALARPPACSVAVAEPQGEAVSEGAGVPVLVRRIP